MKLRKMLGLTQKGAPTADDDMEDIDEEERKRREEEARRNPFSAQIGARNAKAQAQRRKAMMDEAGEY